MLTAGIAALVMTVAEPVVGAVALLLLGVGFVNYFHIGGIPSLILFSLVASVGFHMWMPISSTLALRLSRVTEQGSRLGRLRAVAAVANLAGIGLVALVAGVGGLRPLFVAAGVLAIAGALLVLRVRGIPRTKRPPRILIRRAYWLYYALTFLDGARRHIFMTFALYPAGAGLRIVGADDRPPQPRQRRRSASPPSTSSAASSIDSASA